LASLFWGLPQPLIFNEIKHVPSIEVAFHRGVWSFIFLFFILFFFTRIKDFFLIFYSKKKIFILSITALLISINWIGFIYAVSINRVQDASMGYFITPMISISLGYFFLNEKINKLKFLSVMLMLFAIIFLLINVKTFPYIALIIGTSWGIYGLLRKQISISPAIGLFYECFLISLFSFPYLIYLYFTGSGYYLNHNSYTTLLLTLTGLVTLFPLLLFNLGIKHITLGYAGVLFYLAPSFHFITSILILKEDIQLTKLISFIIIWIGVSIFIFNVIRSEKINENNIL